MGDVQGPSSNGGIGAAVEAAATAIGAVVAKPKAKPATAPTPPATLNAKDQQKTSAIHAAPVVSVVFDPLAALAGAAEDLAIVVVKSADALRKELASVSTPPTADQKERLDALLVLSEHNLANAESRALGKGADLYGRGTGEADQRLQSLGAGYRILHRRMIESIRQAIKCDVLASPSGAGQLDVSLRQVQQRVADDSWNLPNADRQKLWQGVSKELQRHPTDSAELFK